jgi:hypothetical protein
MNRHTDIFQLPANWTKDQIETALAEILIEQIENLPARLQAERPFRRTKAKVVYDR